MLLDRVVSARHLSRIGLDMQRGNVRQHLPRVDGISLENVVLGEADGRLMHLAPHLEFIIPTDPDEPLIADDTHCIERWKIGGAEQNGNGVAPRFHSRRELTLLESDPSRAHGQHTWRDIRNERAPRRSGHDAPRSSGGDDLQRHVGQRRTAPLVDSDLHQRSAARLRGGRCRIVRVGHDSMNREIRRRERPATHRAASGACRIPNR